MASPQLKIPSSSSSRSRLVSKLYGDEVLCALRSLQQNDMLCDFTVTAEGKSLRVSIIRHVSLINYYRVPTPPRKSWIFY